MNVADNLKTLRTFFAEGRQIHDKQGLGFASRDNARRGLGEKMLAWARGVDIPQGAACSAAEAVVCAAASVILACDKAGQSPGWEVAVVPPEFDGVTPGEWRVCWEAGPYQWGVGDSLGAGRVVPARFCQGRWGFTEPYYAFDLTFVKES